MGKQAKSCWYHGICEICGESFSSRSINEPFCKLHAVRGCRCFNCGDFFESRAPVHVPGEPDAFLCPKCANPEPVTVLPSWENRPSKQIPGNDSNIPAYLRDVPGIRWQSRERFEAGIHDPETTEALRRIREAHIITSRRGKDRQIESQTQGGKSDGVLDS